MKYRYLGKNETRNTTITGLCRHCTDTACLIRAEFVLPSRSTPSKSSGNPSPKEKPSSSSKTPTASNAKPETVGQTAPPLLNYVLVSPALSVATSPKYENLLLLVGVRRVLLIAPLYFPLPQHGKQMPRQSLLRGPF